MVVLGLINWVDGINYYYFEEKLRGIGWWENIRFCVGYRDFKMFI